VSQRVLEIVFFLIDVLKENRQGLGDMHSLSADLREMGYGEDEISRAYRLIADGFDLEPDTLFTAFPEQSGAVRVFTLEERLALTIEAQSFLLRLLHSGLIDLELFETIIEQATFSGEVVVDIDHLKQIAAGLLAIDTADTDIVSVDPDIEAVNHLN